jgi:hypothetical protein
MSVYVVALLFCCHWILVENADFWLHVGGNNIVSNDVKYKLEYSSTPGGDNAEWCTDYNWKRVIKALHVFPHVPKYDKDLNPKTEQDKKHLDFILEENKYRTCINTNHIAWIYITLEMQLKSVEMFSFPFADFKNFWCKAYHASVCNGAVGRPGYYMEDYPTDIYTWFQFTYVRSPPKMKPCAPGTWLTCKDSKDCRYVIPKDYQEWQTYAFGLDRETVTGNINVVRNTVGYIPPVGSCYSCNTSRRSAHYYLPSAPDCDFNQNIITTEKCELGFVPIVSDTVAGGERSEIICTLTVCRTVIGFQNDNVICTGGVSPPFPCATGLAADTTRTQCVCVPGKYKKSDNLCEICPAGHYCLDNNKTQCKDGTYQPQMNQPACVECKDDFPCVASNSQPVKCLQSNGIEFQINRGCVPCSRCKNEVIDAEEVTLKLNTTSTSLYKICYPPGDKR